MRVLHPKYEWNDETWSLNAGRLPDTLDDAQIVELGS